jgi:ABC-2 type transport system permease protein
MSTLASAPAIPTIPLSRITTTEIRKMLDTRSGFWLMASIGILAFITTSAVILWAAREELTYSTFVAAINVPMTLVIPMVAILSVTGEWSQRSGLTTFTLIPHRSRVITAKALSSLGVALFTLPLAFGVGALGNLVGTAIAGVEPVWDLSVVDLAQIVLANVLSLMVGFMLGVVIQSSAGALVGYLIYQFVLPSLAILLAMSQDWFHDLQPWVDFNYGQGLLLEGALTSQQWVQLAATGAIWLVVPLAIGLFSVVRAEVK